MSTPTADVSVRVAWADDAPAIAELQLRAWQTAYADLLPAEAIPSGPEAVDAAAAAWRGSMTKPGDARNRVLVALERNRVVGFAITGPASDPDCDPVADAELQEVTLDPAERGKGHGSRLLQAAAETMQADRFTRAVTWVLASDDTLRGVPHRRRVGTRHRAPRAGPRRLGHHARQAGPPAHRSVVNPIVRDSLGVGLATGAYGTSFGALAVTSGLDVAQTCVLSLLMFTGASQFALIGVVASGGSPFSGAAAALLLGTRNTLYGLRLAPLLGWTGRAPRGRRAPGHRRVHGHVGDPGDPGRRPGRAS